MAYKVEPIPRHELDETLREYVCSNCWGPLDFKYDDKKWYALCRTCKADTPGYVSKRFAERQRKNSDMERIEAERNLRNILGLTPEKKTMEENLKDLGF